MNFKLAGLTSQAYPFSYNYPGYLAWLWSLSCLLACSLGWLIDSNFFYIAIASLLLASYRAYQAIYLVNPWLNLNQSSPQQELIEILEQLPTAIKDDNWYLGQGYQWDLRHRQQLHNYQQLLTKANQDLTQAANYLHNLGDSQAITLPIDFGHLLFIGTTGAGKTRAFESLIIQALSRNQATVIIDPKGDQQLKNTIFDCLKSYGREELFFDFNPNFIQGAGLDLFSHYGKSTDLANRLTSIMHDDPRSLPYKSYAYNCCLVILDAMLLLKQKIRLQDLYLNLTKPSFKMIIDGIVAILIKLDPLQVETDIAQQLLAIYKDLEENEYALSEHRKLLRKLSQLLQQALAQQYSFNSAFTPDKYQQLRVVYELVQFYMGDRIYQDKMLGVFLAQIKPLCAGNLGHLLGGINPNLDIDSQAMVYNCAMLKQPIVVYLGLDALSDPQLARNIGKIFLSDLACYLGQLYQLDDQTNPTIINLFIDESNEVANDVLVQLLNKGRAAGLRVVAATQTLSDFEVNVGAPKTQQLLANFNSWIALRTTDFETQQYLANSLGEVELKIIEQNHGTSGSLWLSNGQQGQRSSIQERQLFNPHLFSKLPNLEYIANLSLGNIVKGRIPNPPSFKVQTINDDPITAINRSSGVVHD